MSLRLLLAFVVCLVGLILVIFDDQPEKTCTPVAERLIFPRPSPSMGEEASAPLRLDMERESVSPPPTKEKTTVSEPAPVPAWAEKSGAYRAIIALSPSLKDPALLQAFQARMSLIEAETYEDLVRIQQDTRIEAPTIYERIRDRLERRDEQINELGSNLIPEWPLGGIQEMRREVSDSLLLGEEQ